ncbi:type IV secretion system protein [Rhodanobacter sp. DHG33]|uniref:virB8 family protein n=1 Tax=Rhodanobacter sp. DHG33 TaxID=2775921 RepID=UPI00177ADAA7|nr:type IV secretion system protein [Rhodanobacter sp. DHG33]MBD8900006.1 type IV secretion system protein [Rhodanobacter sp. DHG33]
MLKKNSSSQKIDEAVGKSVNFELTIADLAKRSERRAWMVAFSAIGMSLILAGGYFYMLPLKQKVPYLVMADAYTGTSSVARLTDDPLHARITTSDAVNRSNVAHFVLARESYDLSLLNLGDWTTVQTMSSPGVSAAYTRLYSSTNSDGPYKKYGKDTAIRVKLLSIVLTGGAPGMTPKGATVRFQRSLYDKRSGSTQPLDNKIATMSFTYKTNLDMDDQSRIENPLGFWVTEYRVDDDYSSTPPAEVQDTTARNLPNQGENLNVAPAYGASTAPSPQQATVPQTSLPPASVIANQPMQAPGQTTRSPATGVGRP